MNRRSFFKRMFVGAAAAVGLPLALKETQVFRMDIPESDGQFVDIRKKLVWMTRIIESSGYKVNVVRLGTSAFLELSQHIKPTVNYPVRGLDIYTFNGYCVKQLKGLFDEYICHIETVGIDGMDVVHIVNLLEDNMTM